MNPQQRIIDNLHYQQQSEGILKERNMNQYLEEQNLGITNESFQMRKAIRTYFDSQPFSTIQADKSKGIHSSCSNSYSGDNSDIITTYSQNNHQLANESDLESDDTYAIQQQLKNINTVKNIQNSEKYVAKSCYDALQKAYYELQQKYFNVREEIKENQNQLCSLLTELRSQYQNNQQNSTYSQFSEISMSSKLEEKFTSQINRAFRLMYENLKEESEKTIQQKDEQIKQLDEQKQQLLQVNQVLLQQNEQKENALIDIVQYYGILKQQIDSIKSEKEQTQVNQQGDCKLISNQNQCNNLNTNPKTNVLQNINLNSSFQTQINQYENNYSITSHSSFQSKNNVESNKKIDLQFQSSSKPPNSHHQNSGFSFANGSRDYQQDNEKVQKESQQNKENSHYSITKIDFQSGKPTEKQQLIKEYETFQTEECERSSTLQQQLKPLLTNQTPKSRENQSLLQQNEYIITSQTRLNTQIDTINNFDDQSETVFEDIQAQSAYEWQFTSNQNQNIKLAQLGEENYVSNDMPAILLGSRDRHINQSSSTPNKQFRQLNDYLQTHENNFEQEQEEIQLINQKVKKSNRLNMLSRLKKEIFQEGLKTVLNPSTIQTNRKSSTTPRKLTTSRGKIPESIPTTSRSRIKDQSDLKSTISQIDDPIQRGFMIMEDLYHSIDRRFKNQN